MALMNIWSSNMYVLEAYRIFSSLKYKKEAYLHIWGHAILFFLNKPIGYLNY